MPLGGNTYKCTFNEEGLLTKVEKHTGDRGGYIELKEELAEQGPFRLAWKVEDSHGPILDALLTGWFWPTASDHQAGE